MAKELKALQEKYEELIGTVPNNKKNDANWLAEKVQEVAEDSPDFDKSEEEIIAEITGKKKEQAPKNGKAAKDIYYMISNETGGVRKVLKDPSLEQVNKLRELALSNNCHVVLNKK